MQGRSQPHSPGWARVPLSSLFPQIWINFSYFSSNFTYFLPHFGPPGGQVAHLGRPWLRHCSYVPTTYDLKIDILSITAWEKVYFKSRILVHEYWIILDHFGIPVLFASRCGQHVLKNVNITFSGNSGTRVFTNTGTIQYLGPEVYFFHCLIKVPI